jgi:hypothetical protein
MTELSVGITLPTRGDLSRFGQSGLVRCDDAECRGDRAAVRRGILRAVRTLHLSGGGGSFTITSDEEPEPLYWRVTLTSGGLAASTDIDLDSIRHTVGPIGEFFRELAADWRGWQGERRWGQAPLILAATHDGLGHVAINVQVATNVYSEPDWEARATIELEAGRLDHVARQAAELPGLVASAE